MSRPIQAIIDRAALRHNLGLAKDHAQGASVYAVVKANAYGHGLLRCAQALATSDGFCVLSVDEALTLRQAGFDHPIVLLEGFFSADELPLIAEYRLTPVIHSLEQVDALCGSGLPTRIPIFLKLNTGMNRLGFSERAFTQALGRLKASPQVDRITLMTHFANADEPVGIAAQLNLFRQLTETQTLPRSLANSAALIRFPEARADIVRAGILLYGALTFESSGPAELGLAPVMTLKSRVIAIQMLKNGDSVGYGGDFTAPRKMRIGIVACGYADGYPRHAPSGTPVLVDGVPSSTVGRVSMDMLAVDLTELPEAGIGSEVVLWGESPRVTDVAARAGTNAYELLCAVAARVPVVEV